MPGTASGWIIGYEPVPRSRCGAGHNQHIDEYATGCNGVVGVVNAFSIRTTWCARIAVYAHCDDYRPDTVDNADRCFIESTRIVQSLGAVSDVVLFSGARKVAQFCHAAKEGRADLLVVGLAAFGRAISEIGAVMIVGGNIEHLTRVMTTAIALETSKGNLEFAIALGLVLLTAALVINIVSTMLGRLGSAESL